MSHSFMIVQKQLREKVIPEARRLGLNRADVIAILMPVESWSTAADMTRKLNQVFDEEWPLNESG